MSLKDTTPAGESPAFRLIFHIGAGKTGTSSIQASLNEGKRQLIDQGYDYWGLMLEFAPVNRYPWQKASASKEFLSLNPETATEQVLDVLSRSISQSRANGIHTAIWSNEWFFGRHHGVIPALKALESDGVEVEIIAYVRRHDAWAKSAYVQWGLKHKTYSGPLVPFKEYIRKRPVAFYGTLRPWLEAFPNAFVLRNFDEAGDVVHDFSTLIGIPDDLPKVRTNEMPSAEELLLRALYNNTIKGEANPVAFDRLFQTRQIRVADNPQVWLESLLPSQEDLEQIIDISSGDRAEINELLTNASQPPVTTGKRESRTVSIDQGKLVAMLFQIVVQQAKKLQALQRDHQELAEGLRPPTTE